MFIAHSWRRNGFTLLELLAVISILALLSVLLIPAVQKAVERSKAVQCVNNMHQLGIAFLTYAGDHNGKFPGMPTVEEVAEKDFTKGWQYQIAQYVGYNTATGTPPIFACPSGIVPIKSIPFGLWRGYAMNYFVQEASYHNNTVFGDGRQALLLECWTAGTHAMAGVLMLTGTSQVNFAQKTRLAWRHRDAMNVLRKDGSVMRSLPGESGLGADINWLYRDDGKVWRDGRYRSP